MVNEYKGDFKMEKRILVTLDGTTTGEAVLTKLEDLLLRSTPKMDAEVTLLKVLSKMNFNMLHEDEAAQLPRSEEELNQLTQEARSYLENIAKGLRSKGIKVNIMVASGSAAEEIVRVAHEIQAHLIAMATHGRSGLARWAVGSVTDQVIHLEGNIPVLAVKASGENEINSATKVKSLKSIPKHL
jgi:nucleotide-binding universal stress UspA family protein